MQIWQEICDIRRSKINIISTKLPELSQHHSHTPESLDNYGKDGPDGVYYSYSNSNCLMDRSHSPNRHLPHEEHSLGTNPGFPAWNIANTLQGHEQVHRTFTEWHIQDALEPSTMIYPIWHIFRKLQEHYKYMPRKLENW